MGNSTDSACSAPSEPPTTPAECRGFRVCVPDPLTRRGCRNGLEVAGRRPTPGDRLGRTSRAAGVKMLYKSLLGPIRPATTHGSSPSWSPSGFTALPTGACRPDPDIAPPWSPIATHRHRTLGALGVAPDTRFLGGGVKIFGVAGARCPERRPAALVGQKGACLPWVETRKDLGFGLATTHASVCRGRLFPVSPVLLLTGWRVKEALK